MNMKDHVLAALREHFERWDELFANLSEEQITTPLVPSPWSCKDVVAHVMSWQQVRTIRMDAALNHTEALFPDIPADFDLNGEHDEEALNTWFYESYRDVPWQTVYRTWKEGFFHLIERGAVVSESDLIDGEKYYLPGGWPLITSFIGLYDHHREHLEDVLAWMREHEVIKADG